MKKTQHQSFIDELHKQITGASVIRADSLQIQESTVEDEEKEDIMRELERKFDELFGDLDDDDE